MSRRPPHEYAESFSPAQLVRSQSLNEATRTVDISQHSGSVQGYLTSNHIHIQTDWNVAELQRTEPLYSIYHSMESQKHCTLIKAGGLNQIW